MVGSSHATYESYLSNLKKVLDEVDVDALDEIAEIIAAAYARDATVFVAGNGGSAATASHLACDFSKTTIGRSPRERPHRLKSIALSDSSPLLTAYGNDISYDDIFSEPVKTLSRPGDVLIIISASGNSKNILKALEAAKEIGTHTVAFLGFQGGKAKDLADKSIIVKSESYGVIEDAHSIFMHLLTEHLKEVVAKGR